MVYEEGRRIMENIGEIEALLSGLKEEPTGTLSVVSGPVCSQIYHPYLEELIEDIRRSI